jgi:hypothetical protein
MPKTSKDVNNVKGNESEIKQRVKNDSRLSSRINCRKIRTNCYTYQKIQITKQNLTVKISCSWASVNSWNAAAKVGCNSAAEKKRKLMQQGINHRETDEHRPLYTYSEKKTISYQFNF